MKLGSCGHLILIVVALVAVSEEARADSYTIADLGTTGVYTHGLAINDSGQVVGTRRTASGVLSAFIYTGGTMTDILPGATSTSQAKDINSTGQVVVYNDGRAWVYSASSGTMVDLGIPPDMDTVIGYGINNSGHVSGLLYKGGGYESFIHDGAGFTRFAGPAGRSGAYAINDSGVAAGTYGSNTTARQVPFMFDGTTLTEIDPRTGTGKPAGTVLGGEGYAGDINNLGQVVWSHGWASGGQAWLYSPATNESTWLGRIFSGTWEVDRPASINEHGQIVGYSQSRSWTDKAFIYDDGVMLDLSALLPSGSGWTSLIRAYDINNRGQIVGVGSIDGEYHAFLMTPTTNVVPEPTSLALLGLGVAGLGWHRRRRRARAA